MNKGGKYIFGWSVIRENGKITFPTPAVEEYKLQKERYIYIVSGSKQTGGFCVMSEPLLLLAIRSSDIAFTFGAKGALIQKAHEYTGEIEVF